jgi:hypothetical protein
MQAIDPEWTGPSALKKIVITAQPMIGAGDWQHIAIKYLWINSAGLG